MPVFLYPQKCIIILIFPKRALFRYGEKRAEAQVVTSPVHMPAFQTKERHLKSKDNLTKITAVQSIDILRPLFQPHKKLNMLPSFINGFMPVVYVIFYWDGIVTPEWKQNIGKWQLLPNYVHRNNVTMLTLCLVKGCHCLTCALYKLSAPALRKFCAHPCSVYC